MNPPAHNSESRWQVGLLALACGVYLCGLTIADPDLWGHTLYGLRAIERGVLVERTDPFSYTVEGGEWINHEWFVEWQFGWLWGEFGNLGLVWWRNLVVALTLGIAIWTARTASVAGMVAVFAPLSICLSQFTCFARPQLATYALLAATLAIVRQYAARGGRAIWALPPLFVLWTNLHGGFLAGLGVLFIVGLELVRRAWFGEERTSKAVTFGLVALACGIGTLLTPYGYSLYRMLWYHLGTEQIVSEWRPLWATRFAPAYYVAFIPPVIAFAWSRRWTWLDLVLVLVVAVQAAMHLKHVALLAVTGLVVLPVPMSDAVRRLFPGIHAQWSVPERRWLRWTGTAAVLLIIAGLQLRSTLPLWSRGVRPWDIAVSTRGDSPGVPLRAIRHLDREGLHGNIVTEYGWAQFVIWHCHPRSRIAFDGRYRTVYPAKIEEAYTAFVTGEDDPQADDLVDDRTTDIVLLSTNRRRALEAMRGRRGWETAYEDEQAVLFVREKDVGSAEQKGTVAAEWEVFPGRPVHAPTAPPVGSVSAYRR